MPRDEDDEYEDFGGRMAKQALGGRTALALPTGLSLFRPKRSGSLTIDIIPFVVGEESLRYDPEMRSGTVGKRYPERTYYCHRKIGVNGDSYACLGKTFGQSCPVCQEIAELKKSPHADDAKLVKALKASQRQLWLVWDDEDRDRGVQLWDEANWNFGKHLISYIDGARKDDKAAYKLFYHRDRGFQIRLTCNKENIGGGDNYTYTVHQFYPRAKPIPDHIWNHGYDLDGMVRKLDYKALKDIYHGIADPEEVLPDDRGRDTGRPERDPERSRSPRDEDRQTRPPAPRQTADHREADRRDDRDQDPPPRAQQRSTRPVDDDPPPRTAPAKRPAPPPEPDPEDAPLTCATGDTVSFEYREETLEGEVIRIDVARRLVYVEVEGVTKPYTVAMEDVTVLKADDTFDRKPPPREPDPVPAPKGRAKPPAEDPPRPSPAAARRSAWDDEDEDPRTTKAPPAKPAADDDAPPPAKKWK